MVKSRKKITPTKKTRKKPLKESPSQEVDLTIPAEVIQSDKALAELFGEVEDYAIILMDPSGKILTWNKGAEKIKGYTAAEIIGKHYRLFFPQEDRNTKLSEKLFDPIQLYEVKG